MKKETEVPLNMNINSNPERERVGWRMRGIEEGDQVSVERKGLSVGVRVAYIGAQGGLRLALALSYRVMLKRYRFLFFSFLDSKIVK